MKRSASKTALSPWSAPRKKPWLGATALWTVDRLRRPIAAFGVEYPKFRTVLETRLWMETRQGASQNPSSRASAALGLALMAFYASMSGVAAGVVALATHDVRLWLLVGLGAWMFSLLLLSLTYFAALLTDATDIGVLGALPISDRTTLAARIAHVMTYALLFTIFSALAPTLLGCFAFTPWKVLIVYPLGALSTSALVIASVACAFAIVLRVFGPGRFQRLTFWIQVLGGAALMFGIQVLPQLRGARHALARALEQPFWRFFTPPMHFEGLYNALGGSAAIEEWALAALGLALPIAVGGFALVLTKRHFLAALTDPGLASQGPTSGFRAGIFARLGAKTCSSPPALAAYGWVFAMSRRERVFLRGVVPQAVLFLTISAVTFAKPDSSTIELGGSVAPLAIYAIAIGAVTALFAAEYAEKPDAVSIFKTLPIDAPQALLEGAAKALLIGIVFPATLVGALLTSAITGPSSWPEIVLAACSTAYAATSFTRQCLRDLPFSKAPGGMPAAERLGWMLAAMLGVAALVALHMLLRMHFAALALGVAFFAWRLRSAWSSLERIAPDRGAALERMR